MKIKSVTKFKRHNKLIIEGITRGEKAIRDGDIFSHSQAKEKMKKWLK